MRARPGRWWTVAAGLGLMAAIAIVPTMAAASGGGGCGQPVTDGSGGEVEIEGYCFAPTILRVAPGDVVTFSNLDPVPHSVLGANATWGDYAGFKRKDVLYRFSEPGVYPYLCTYHVGMVGAVVVGDGIGGVGAATTADGPVTRVDASELELSRAAALTVPTPRDDDVAWQILLAGIGGILVGSGGTLVAERHRRHRSSA